MSRAIGIGLIGVGWMGRVHAAAYRRVADHFPECAGVPRLVVAADDSAERAGSAVETLGFERSTTDWREVIADSDVEAVSITAPNRLHRDVAPGRRRGGQAFLG